MNISTDATDPHGLFDARYTCDFDNSSPELRWDDIPAHCKSFALIAEDPDAPQGLFTHWVVYNIPAGIRHLPAGIPAQEILPNGIRQGVNSAGKLGYSGPCPPLGQGSHRYYFRLYALSAAPSNLPGRATREQLLKSIESSILATAELMGRYQRAIQKAG